MSGAEAPIAAAVIGGLSTIYQVSEQNSAAKKQQQAVANAQVIADEKAGNARSAILANAEKYAPDQRAKEQSDIEGKMRSSFEGAQASASPAPVSTLGATSDAYAGAVQKGAETTGARAQKLNTLFSKTLAPGRLAVNESIRDASTGEEANSVYGGARRAMSAGAADASTITPGSSGAIIGGIANGIAQPLAAGKLKMPTLFSNPYAVTQ